MDQVPHQDEDAAAREARALLARSLLDQLRQGPGRRADGRPGPAVPQARRREHEGPRQGHQRHATG